MLSRYASCDVVVAGFPQPLSMLIESGRGSALDQSQEPDPVVYSLPAPGALSPRYADPETKNSLRIEGKFITRAGHIHGRNCATSQCGFGDERETIPRIA